VYYANKELELLYNCFIKSPTSAKSSEFAFNKKIILFNGISSIKSGLFNIILLNKLFLREWLAKKRNHSTLKIS
jgi:hypothetical protein